MKEKLLKEACQEATLGVSKKEGGPFGAIIADHEGNIISRGHNMVLKSHDPTNHAEIVAIREACRILKTHDLKDYIIYSSCEPCPMCLSAIIWANIPVLYYGATREDAAKAGFRDDAIYDYFQEKNYILIRENIKSDLCKTILEDYKGEIY